MIWLMASRFLVVVNLCLLGAWIPLKRTLLSSLSECVCACVGSLIATLHETVSTDSSQGVPDTHVPHLFLRCRSTKLKFLHHILAIVFFCFYWVDLLDSHLHPCPGIAVRGRIMGELRLPLPFRNWRTWQPHTHGVLCLTGLLLPEPPLSLTLFDSPGWFGWVG